MTLFFQTILLFLKSRWSPVAFIITALGIIYQNFLGIAEKISEVILMTDSVVRPVVEEVGISVSVLGFVNYVLPLDLMLAYLNLYLPFLVICCTVRFIKSWIPLVGT